MSKVLVFSKIGDSQADAYEHDLHVAGNDVYGYFDLISDKIPTSSKEFQKYARGLMERISEIDEVHVTDESSKGVFGRTIVAVCNSGDIPLTIINTSINIGK